VGGLVEVVRSPTFSTAVGLVRYGMSRNASLHATEQAKRGGFLHRFRRTLTNVF
jgi:cell division ATPase FtsA